MTKKISMFACVFCLTASVSESKNFNLLISPESADVSSSSGTSGSCMSKKISGKISPVPRLKCRFS